MQKWIIWNTTERKWVTPDGSKNSFTRSREKAKVFPSFEAAERECCGNEHPVRAVEACNG